MEDSRHLTWTRRVEASMDMDLGQINEPRRALEATLSSALRADDLQTTVPHLGQLVRAYGMAGQTVRADKTAGSLLECLARRPLSVCRLYHAVVFACQWLATQPAAQVSEQSRACLSHLERLDAELHAEESRAALAEARGCLLLGAGRAQAQEHLRHAATSWGTIGRPYDQARARGSLGRALVMTGDASVAYAQARDILDSLASQLDEQQRASFLASPLFCEVRRARGAQPAPREPRAVHSDSVGLTEREIEVLRLVAQGLTNAQIAERLVISPLTVNAHLRSIFNKLDVTRRAAAARIAVEHELV